MSGWGPRRFWTDVSVRPADGGGHALWLDDRAARTPGKLPLVLPTAALAAAVAAEWQAQDREIRPQAMPMTRMANSAIEKVAPRLPEVAAAVAAYGSADLLCYRAPGPPELVRRQAAWDAPLAWAAQRYGARLVLAQGVMPVAQPPQALARLGAAVAAHPPFPLTALHDLVALTGSLVLGLAAAEDHLPAAEAWRLSRIDEDWQAEQWGADAEATAAADARRLDLDLAKRFLVLARTPD
jgi:chaperone required for assembly of F1-ATPase